MNCCSLFCFRRSLHLCSKIPTSTYRLYQLESFHQFRRQFSRSSPNFRRNGEYTLRDTSWRDFMGIYEIAKPFKWWIVAGTSFMVISSSIFLIIPRVLGNLIDKYGEHHADDTDQSHQFTIHVANFLKQHPIALVAILATGAVATAAKVYFLQVAGVKIVGSLRTAVFRSVLQQEMTFFDRNLIGEIGSRHAADTIIIGYSVTSSLRSGIRATLIGVGSIGAMLLTSIELSTVALLTAPIAALIFRMFGRVQKQCTQQLQQIGAEVNRTATERMGHIKTVRMLSAESRSIEDYRQKGADIVDVSKVEALAKGCLIGSFQFLGYSSFSSILFYGTHLINEGLMTYGELSSFCIYSFMAAASLANISGFYNEVMKGLGASSRLLELKNTQPSASLCSGLDKTSILDSIRFENVSFRYPTRRSTLQNVTFEIPRGKITAVIGPSGSGKSSIANLMLRLYDPTSGRVAVDGVDLRDINPTKWRHAIGTVGQEPVLFTCSIRENILMGVEDTRRVTQRDIEEAAMLANALDFIRSFDAGFDTMVGEHGCKLSGGQKQRIAIARALISKPKILILDEATSALDATSDYLIRRTIHELLQNHDLTVLVIAHRLATMQQADQVVFINNGRVWGTGSFEEMMKVQNSVVEQEAIRRGIPIHEQMSKVHVPL